MKAENEGGYHNESAQACFQSSTWSLVGVPAKPSQAASQLLVRDASGTFDV
jgi:hypothetical protein